MSKRESWDKWKERNAWWWDIVTVPVSVLGIGIFLLYWLYLRICRLFGWRPWRLP